MMVKYFNEPLLTTEEYSSKIHKPYNQKYLRSFKNLFVLIAVLFVCGLLFFGMGFVHRGDTALPHAPAENIEEFKYTIVTAASANHFCPLQSYLYTLQDTIRYMPPSLRPRIVVYDLGIGEFQRATLEDFKAQGYFHELVTFDYSQYPSFWSVHINRGEYGWKTGIIYEVAQRYPGVILWMDSGDRAFPHFLVDVVNYVEKYGIFSPPSKGTIPDFTHPGMMKHFDDSMDRYAKFVNCNGAFIAFDARNTTIMNDVIKPWAQCGLLKDCIAPVGSSRANHRQDQAAFTYLMAKNGYRCRFDGLTGLLTHLDKDCKIQIENHLARKQQAL
ncbi:hypothetical protein K493DRAFT_290539 [Basidiobolus meristosporus CBS 931.73]|uniref:Uncharacterized protein n=1 Tax=Basidiobolus meristosporus CBS 931.73 TaxID=1314790 RepID=A0A1Y1XRT8_9FUNG|nr:hypothetical protein K493DRAFT_290539 [Basidiobolus meristosporus CBS 931.73]|eukprot:ORX88479.1 hypothetical protein K493DRAFT_290539 [Basidiobolus meristosporus CBS 931.73]